MHSSCCYQKAQILERDQKNMSLSQFCDIYKVQHSTQLCYVCYLWSKTVCYWKRYVCYLWSKTILAKMMWTDDTGGVNLFSFSLFKQLCSYPTPPFKCWTLQWMFTRLFCLYSNNIGRGSRCRKPELGRHPGNYISTIVFAARIVASIYDYRGCPVLLYNI